MALKNRKPEYIKKLCENMKTEKLEPSNRFSLEKLLSFCA